MERPIKALVVFEVRNDRNLGVLVSTIRCSEKNIVHFFREHHQPVKQHPEQVQEIIRKKCPAVGRKKNVQIDITHFYRQYSNGIDFEFKGVVLNSTTKQVNAVYSRVLNKQIGTQKRLKTIKEAKQEKIEKMNAAIRLKLEEAEERFQSERAKRLVELYGPQPENTTEPPEQQNPVSPGGYMIIDNTTDDVSNTA